MKFFKHFGANPSAENIARYSQSPNWKNGRFENLEETSMSVPLSRFPAVIYKMLSHGKAGEPPRKLELQAFPQEILNHDGVEAKMIWFGHSALFIRVAGLNILIDPMLGPDTSPIAPRATKRFSEGSLELIDDLPEIDLLLQTHDHYDHLDLDSMLRLKNKVLNYAVALGVGRHLISWGVDTKKIRELDWWDTFDFEALKITFTPTRHFSGRGIRDRQKSFWGGWVLETPAEKIWFSGDGGYGKHFKEIGERLGPFDFGMMECGQYGRDWHPIHLFPDECIQAAIDAGAHKIMPVHWGAFVLSYEHTWAQPVSEFVQHARDHSIDYMVPQLGQAFEIKEKIQDPWWEI